jgi:DNA-directed RNA polymerase specialized sigma24 family protein
MKENQAVRYQPMNIKTIIWQQSQAWVCANKTLIWCIAAPYYRHMPCDFTDLAGEAQVVAFQVISSLTDQGKDMTKIAPYFRVVYRSRCIQLAAGVPNVADLVPAEVVAMEQEQSSDLEESIIKQALLTLTHRQRQISQWILEQPHPVSITAIAKHFGVHRQNIDRILSSSIHRIKNTRNQDVNDMALSIA